MSKLQERTVSKMMLLPDTHRLLWAAGHPERPVLSARQCRQTLAGLKP
jgi:hypothetical protein